MGAVEELARGTRASAIPMRFWRDRMRRLALGDFTVTTTGTEFLDEITADPQRDPGSGGLVSLNDSPWLLSLSVFHQPEIMWQPPGTCVWWGYGLHPEGRHYVQKRMDACSGAEILEELLRQLRFDEKLNDDHGVVDLHSLRHALREQHLVDPQATDRPRPVPEGSTNLGLIGQYVEVPRDVAFTIEYSARTAWEAIYLLLKRGPSTAARLSGPVRSKSAVRRVEAVRLSGGYPTESCLMCWRRRKWIWDGSNRWSCVPNEP